MIDLDGLRAINESLGRGMGDDAIRQLARRLTEGMRRSDTIARTGGDKFTLMGQVTHGKRDASALARKVISILGKPLTLGDREISLSVNVGISLFPDDADAGSRLLHAAEVALHRAKRQGRNVFQFFQVGQTETTLADLELEGQFRHAVESALEQQAFGNAEAPAQGGRLALHYQPQVLADGRIVGVEALARWAHPTLGRIPPDRFISVAEQTGLIVPFGDWALREAITQACRWRDRFGAAAPRMAVNVSAIQFATPRFVDNVERLLADTKLEPGWIELELTETVLMTDADEASKKIARLRALGLAVAIDDFGTGYSSLAYLHRLTIDTLKIDRSFVNGLTADRRPPGATDGTPQRTGGVAVTRAIISMGKSLGMSLVAEGVETEAQRALLNRLGCDVMQGFLFSPPVEASRIEQMLSNGASLPQLATVAVPA